MGRPRLFHSQLSAGEVTLSPEESRHASRVLRCRVNDQVVLFDGKGGEGVATVTEVNRGGVILQVADLAKRPFDQRVRLTLAVALPRAPRQPFMFEKCTELGVWAVWPMVCERSVVKPAAGQVEKWRRTTIEACKQCGRAWLPRIELPRPFSETLAHAAEFDTAVVTHADTSFTSLVDVLAASGTRSAGGCSGESDDARTLLVWVGPEGGLSPEEIAAAVGVGAVGAQLGSHVLRVETAAITVAALCAVQGTR